MLRLTTSLTTIPHHCDHLSFLPRSPSPSLFPSALSRSPAPLSCLYLSIYSVLARAFRFPLRPFRALPPRTAAPCHPLAPTTPFSLARTLLVPISIFLSLVSSVHLFRSSSRAPPRSPSHSRLHRTGGAPADFAFKFGKFAGVGKWAAGMVSNTRARARPPIHCV